MECRLQGHKLKPNNIEGNFQTLKLNIGYASKVDGRAYKKLLEDMAVVKVEVDYSFNEKYMDIESIDVGGTAPVHAYGLTTLVAEKLRAILQQEVRERFRRQDIFDLNSLLTRDYITEDRHMPILKALVEKALDRNIKVSQFDFSSNQIYRRAKREYGTLASDVVGDLPDFDLSFATVRSFYEQLPWNSIKLNEMQGE